VSLYAKHGEHRDIVQPAPGKFMSLAAPHSFEILENGLANGIEGFEKAK